MERVLKRQNLQSIASMIRAKIIQLSHETQTPHLGSSLSCVDILVAAYWGILDVDPEDPRDPGRDRLILSKGHAASALYVTLWKRGFFGNDLLDSFGKPGGCLPEHPSPACAPGVEVVSGSLGHGLSLGLGMALAAKIQKKDYRVFVVMSDGECNEGSVWESAMLAPAHALENLVTIVDFNRWQATGRSEEVTALSPLNKKWESFGWSAYNVDGHDVTALLDLFRSIPEAPGKPTAIIAHTVKGKGVSFMEDDNNWHYRIPTADEVSLALKELGRS
jgi:transketolase